MTPGIAESNDDDSDDDGDFQQGEDELELSRLLYAEVIHDRDNNCLPDREQLAVGDGEGRGETGLEKNAKTENVPSIRTSPTVMVAIDPGFAMTNHVHA